jgi:hypothetical protein
VTNLDALIDELYRLPAAGFTAARNALAKTLGRDDAARVRTLEKPLLVPWAVNQLYWHARPTYDRLMRAGQALRRAEVAALEGGKTEAKALTTAHRAALADATSRALQIALDHGLRAPADVLTRMLETLSLTATPPGRAGRFTQVLQPAGFEALAGVQPVATPTPTSNPSAASARIQPRVSPRGSSATDADRLRAMAARSAAEAQLRTAKSAVAAAEEADQRAETQLREARAQLERAEQSSRAARRALDEAREQVTRAGLALQRT